jgi:uncharacterized membrane protein YidH (DUF202 family)
MKWLQLVSTLLIQYSVQQRQVKEAPEKIKGMSIQAAIYFLGLCFFIILAMAGIIMTFADLGKQWDQNDKTHFSGPILASVLMFGVGVVVFGMCVLLARYLAKKPEKELPATTDEPKTASVNPLSLFAEEFVAQLISKLK